MIRVRKRLIEKLFEEYYVADVDEQGNEKIISVLYSSEKEITSTNLIDDLSIDEAKDKYPWLAKKIKLTKGNKQ